MIDVIARRSDVCALMLYQWATENPLVSKASTIFMCDTRHLSCKDRQSNKLCVSK